jgi:Ca2+-binding EF-hand superfamily protein
MKRTTTGAGKLQRVCERVRQDLEFRNVELVQVCASYDRNGSGRVKPGVVTSELEDRGVKITPEDMELLMSFAQPDERGFIDYNELYLLISKGPDAVKEKEKEKEKVSKVQFEEPKERKKKKKKSSDEDEEEEVKKKKMKRSRIVIDEAFEELIESCISYMERTNYSISALHRRCDKNGDGDMTFAEFYKSLLPTIELYPEEELAERIFKRVDKDDDERISLVELETALTAGRSITQK